MVVGEAGVMGCLEECWYMSTCNFLYKKCGLSHTDVYHSHKCLIALCSDPLYQVSSEMENKGGKYW